MSDFIRILNWDRLQHYKDRNPPWIKLHRDLLTSETWVSSDNDDRVLAVAIMMLAAATGNRIPANPRYVQRIAYLEKEPDFAGLIRLKFIEIIQENLAASKPLASARPETETERDTDSVEPSGSTGAAAPSAIDLRAAVFSSGVPLLMQSGLTERNARSMLGRWRSDYRDGPVLDALATAQGRGPSEIVPYIRRTLEGKNGHSVRGTGADPLLADYRRAVEEDRASGGEAADPGAWPSLSAAGGGSA